jgi:hypothetical protein
MMDLFKFYKNANSAATQAGNVLNLAHMICSDKTETNVTAIRMLAQDTVAQKLLFDSLEIVVAGVTELRAEIDARTAALVAAKKVGE